jgi:hypothetical protein
VEKRLRETSAKDVGPSKKKIWKIRDKTVENLENFKLIRRNRMRNELKDLPPEKIEWTR